MQTVYCLVAFLPCVTQGLISPGEIDRQFRRKSAAFNDTPYDQSIIAPNAANTSTFRHHADVPQEYSQGLALVASETHVMHSTGTVLCAVLAWVILLLLILMCGYIITKLEERKKAIKEPVVHMLVCALDYSKTNTPLSCTVDGNHILDLASQCKVKTIQKLFDEEATQANMIKSIKDVGSNCNPGEYFVFYYAGHGGCLTDNDGDEADEMDEAYCLVDESGQMPQEAWLRDDDFAKAVSSSVKQGTNILIISDSCHSGTIADFARPEWSGHKAISISGCKDEQEAGAFRGGGGIFTQSMLLALDELSKNASPIYTVGELFDATTRKDKEVFNIVQNVQTLVMLKHPGLSGSEMDWPLRPPKSYKAPPAKNTGEFVERGQAAADDRGSENAKRILAEGKVKEAAVAALKDAVRKGDVQLLREAIKKGVSAGLKENDKDLQDARAKLLAEEKKIAAHEALQRALTARDLEALRREIEAAKSAGLIEDELAEARSVLAEGEKALARKQLQDAIKSENAGALSAAISRAEAAGLSPDDLQYSKDVLAVVEGLTEAIASKDPVKLRSAIENAERAGLTGRELENARQARKKAEAICALKQAVASLDIEALQSALENGKAAGLEPGDLADAQALLEDLQRKATARDELAKAISSKDISHLRSAIDEAEACGLESGSKAGWSLFSRRTDELAEAKKVLAEEERKAEAKTRLQEAVQSRDVGRIEKEIKDGRKHGLIDDDMQEARAVLLDEKRKAEARSKLQKAVQSRDIGRLETALREGAEAGLTDNDVQEAQAVLRDEQRKAEASSKLQEAVQSGDIDQLSSAIAEGEAAGLDGEELAKARKIAKEEEEARKKAAAAKASASSSKAAKAQEEEEDVEFDLYGSSDSDSK